MYYKRLIEQEIVNSVRERSITKELRQHGGKVKTKIFGKLNSLLQMPTFYN